MALSVGRSGISLSDDLFIEILTKLPLKSLSRFQCVSKAWHRLISDECIRKRQPLIVSGVFYLCGANLNRKPRHGSMSDGGFNDCDLSFFPFRTKSILVDCCNGLLLFFSWLPATFYVCNPTTKRWVVLPKPRKQTQLSVLAFDPFRSPHYKVICFTGWRAQGAELEVFSSETGRWAEREVDWGIDTDDMSATIRYFDGALHILAYPHHIVGIDLETMTCRRIELPEPAKHEGCMGKSGGHLHYTNNDGDTLRIWVLEDSSNCKWVLKHSIRVPEAIHASPSPLPRGFNFLAFHPEMEIVYVWVPGKLVSYDLRNKRFEEVCELWESAYLLQIWLFPFSRFMSDCLAELE